MVSQVMTLARNMLFVSSRPHVTSPTRQTSGFSNQCNQARKAMPRRRRAANFPLLCATARDTQWNRAIGQVTNLFPLWVAGGAVGAVTHPPLFTWFTTAAISPTLALITLGMGLTLSWADFAEVLANPRIVLTAALAQFTIMPLLGALISNTLLVARPGGISVPTAYRVGLSLVACCPGGAASNLVCYLGGASVPLSVLMTLTTTVASVFATPALMLLLAGAIVPVKATALLYSTLQVVIAPLVAGVFLNTVFPRQVRRVIGFLPLLSVVGVVLICSSIVASHAAGGMSILYARRLLGSLMLLHAGGFALGYLAGRFIPSKNPEQTARTLSIEVGMQNSGLGAALATAHFVDPLTAIPCALSATLHSVLGSLLAGIWRAQKVAGSNKSDP